MAGQLLRAQTLLVYWFANGERPPPAPALLNIPARFGEWKQLREDPIAADVAGELKADQILSRTYGNDSNGSVAGVFVAWFQSQRSGAGQPHSPKVCLPAAGWTSSLADETTLNTDAGTIVVNRYIASNRGRRNVVLYWYQGPRRVTAGEWAAKLWLLADAFRDRRTDTSIVRVVVESGGADDLAAVAAAKGFARHIYPLLLANLPR